MLTDGEIMSIINDHDDPQVMCDALIAHANEKGGSDNISVIVFRCDELPKREEVLSEETHLKPGKTPGTDSEATPGE
jgi:serine/threonine protein phosphatase PrpC